MFKFQGDYFNPLMVAAVTTGIERDAFKVWVYCKGWDTPWTYTFPSEAAAQQAADDFADSINKAQS